MMPSLSGSSSMSSGVISEFRRALVWADGGGGGVAAAAACPLIVSSFNDIPGRGAESGAERPGSEIVNRDRWERIDDDGGTEQFHRHFRFSGGIVEGDSVGSLGEGSSLSGHGGGCGGSGSGGDSGAVVDKYRVKKNLTWRWPEFCSASGAQATHQGPLHQSPPRGSYLRHRGTTDFREFFDNEEEEAARRQQPKAYAHLGALREEGKVKYLFDRTSHTGKGSLGDHLRGDYEPRAEGYRGTNVHAATGWRRLNSILDRREAYAMERVAKSDRELKKQGVWVQQQSKARGQRRQRANHMLEASILF
ncbi:unnamed protein product [Pylaiella littoralis]